MDAGIDQLCKTLRPRKKCPRMETSNSSGNEIANVNFLYHDILHALQNTIDCCINSATDQRGYAMAIGLRRSRSFKVTDFGTNRKLIYDFLLVITTNVPPILHRFQVRPMADYWSNFR